MPKNAEPKNLTTGPQPQSRIDKDAGMEDKSKRAPNPIQDPKKFKPYLDPSRNKQVEGIDD